MIGLCYIGYLLTWSFHCYALFWAIKTWYENDGIFINGNVLKFFSCRDERMFFAVVIGGLLNVTVMIVKPYFYSYSLLFFHAIIGSALLSWQLTAYNYFKGRQNETSNT